MLQTNKPIASRRLAVLIDGDNAQPSLIKKILSEASKYGTVTVKRNYGDWTTTNMNGWKDTLNTYAVQPIQQFRYTIGKNATDSAMIIDAMDLLYSGTVDAFCLVSSDSDYTRLATRIREKGFFVMGIGQKKTPRPFVNACDVFVYTENLMPKKPSPRSRSGKKKSNGGANGARSLNTCSPPSTKPDRHAPLSVPCQTGCFFPAVQHAGRLFPKIRICAVVRLLVRLTRFLCMRFVIGIENPAWRFISVWGCRGAG